MTDRERLDRIEQRRIEMIGSAPDLVIAFWDGRSKGTAHTMAEARKRGIRLERIGG